LLLNNSIMKKKILIIEDDLALSNVLQMTLKKSYDLLLAKNGKEGVELAASRLPDLILMDIKMPVMDGFIALTILKENEATATIPVIFLSDKVQYDDLLRGFRMGADHYITKPFTSTELLSGIDLFLEGEEHIEPSVPHHLSA